VTGAKYEVSAEALAKAAEEGTSSAETLGAAAEVLHVGGYGIIIVSLGADGYLAYQGSQAGKINTAMDTGALIGTIAAEGGPATPYILGIVGVATIIVTLTVHQ
jgi:hypothetical protein